LREKDQDSSNIFQRKSSKAVTFERGGRACFLMIINNNKRNRRKTRIIKEICLMKTGGKGWNQNV